MDTNRILALDIGHKRTGVAISDDRNLISFPLTQFEAMQKKEWLAKVAEILELEPGVGKIVVGIPLNHHGEQGADALEIQKFVTLLQERFKLPVVEWDERFTTVQAERTLIDADISRKKRKGVIDKVAATIILQSYLDSLQFQNTQWEET